MSNANKMDKPRNPIPTIDIILSENSNSNKVLLIKRSKDPFKDYFSLPGGFVNEGEKVEDAVRRESEEELLVKVEPINILGVYSDPNRDPRGHIMSITFIAKIIKGNLKEGDGVTELRWVEINNLENIKLGFDHSKILSDYETWLKNKETYWSSKYNIG
ncbi:MAG: NUDIX domain-containing protein [Nitrososphaeraceae archaeon]